MDERVFESRVLELFYKRGDRVTSQLAAYQIGCPVETARILLEAMAGRGTVEMQVDDRGAIFFDLPHRPPPTHEPLSWHQPPAFAPAVPMRAAPVPMYAPPVVPMYAPPVPVYAPHLVVGQEKSVAASIVLTFFFGPLGMFYSTVTGALVMLFAGTAFVVLTLGLGIIVVFPGSIVWAALAANSHNTRLRMQLHQMNMQQFAHAQALQLAHARQR